MRIASCQWRQESRAKLSGSNVGFLPHRLPFFIDYEADDLQVDLDTLKGLS